MPYSIQFLPKFHPKRQKPASRRNRRGEGFLLGRARSAVHSPFAPATSPIPPKTWCCNTTTALGNWRWLAWRKGATFRSLFEIWTPPVRQYSTLFNTSLPMDVPRFLYHGHGLSPSAVPCLRLPSRLPCPRRTLAPENLMPQSPCRGSARYDKPRRPLSRR